MNGHQLVTSARNAVQALAAATVDDPRLLELVGICVLLLGLYDEILVELELNGTLT